MKNILTILLTFIASILLAQPLILNNDVRVTMKGGVNIIINPADGSTIQTSIKLSGTGGGYIVSEEEINKVKIWTRDYMFAGAIMNIPFANSAGVTTKIIITSTTPGSNDGAMIFSTAPTTADNKLVSSTAYPSTVTNMNNTSGSDNSANVIDRFWFVDEVGYTTKPVSQYAFYYSDADLGTLTEGNLQAQVWNGTIWVLPPVGVVFTGANNVGNIPSTTGSIWTLVDKDTPLPIELLYFNVECQVDNLLFKWATASEINSNNFFIEKSVDGINWGAIKMVSAQGNSNMLHEYSVSYPFQDEHYYRLTEIDYDGAYQQSNIVYSECENVIVNVTISPNPTNTTAKVRYNSYSEEPYNIIIYDQIGKTIYEKNRTIDVIHDVNLENYSTGIYTIKIYNSHGIYTNKIIKL